VSVLARPLWPFGAIGPPTRVVFCVIWHGCKCSDWYYLYPGSVSRNALRAPLGLLCCDRNTQSGSRSGGNAEINAIEPSTSRVDGRAGLVLRAQTHAATSLECDLLNP
jgi:hypothetical protein